MQASTMIRTMVLSGILATVGWGQNVFFEIVPQAGVVVNPGINPVVVVEPGTVLPYEVVAIVDGDPTAPNAGGLGSFAFNVVTDLGVPQSGPFTFAGDVNALFTIGRTFGTTTSDDIVNIGASQNLAGPVNTSFALNNRQTLGTGQLVTPEFEGDFLITVVGQAGLITTGTSIGSVPAIVGASPRMVVQTRFQDSTTPSGDDTDDDQDTGGDPGPVTPPVIPGGPAGPSGPGGSDDDQVAGEAPGPPVTGILSPGFCGLGTVSALAATFVGLALLRREW